MKRVLSIDGGGVFGLVPIQVLRNLEDQLGSPLYNHFDLVVGNSAGSIIAAMIAAGMSMQKIHELHMEHLPKVFKKNFFRGLFSVGGVFNTKYSSKAVEKLTMKYMDFYLAEAKTNLMVVSYDMAHTEPFFFKSWKSDCNDNPTYEAVLASTAAPTFFAPREFNSPNADWTKTERTLVDGALAANSPAMCAYAEAIKLWPHEPVKIVSLGTGEIRKVRKYKQSKKWGLLSWAPKVVGAVLDGGVDVVDYQLKRISEVENRLTYYRVDTWFDGDEVGSMDDASKSNMLALVGAGRALADEHSKPLTELMNSHKSSVKKSSW